MGVFVFTMRKEEHDSWTQKYSKVKGIATCFKETIKNSKKLLADFDSWTINFIERI